MSDERHRHDPETIALGLARIAEIRAQLAERNPDRSLEQASIAVESTKSQRAAVDDVRHDVDWSPDKITAEMAVGAERDQLLQRVAQLEAECEQLRSALANVLSAAASGLHSPTEYPADSDHDHHPS